MKTCGVGGIVQAGTGEGDNGSGCGGFTGVVGAVVGVSVGGGVLLGVGVGVGVLGGKGFLELKTGQFKV
jgi:hypothetical protein